MGIPGGCDGRHRYRFHILNDLAVTGDGVIKDVKGFEVSCHRELVAAALPKEDDILGVFGEAGAESGELVQDGDPLAENMMSLALVELEPGV